MSQRTRTGRSAAPLVAGRSSSPFVLRRVAAPFDAGRTSGADAGRDTRPLEPGLEHEHVPQVVLVVPTAREVLGPPGPDRVRLEVPLVAQARRVEQLLGPRPKRPAKPGADRHAEAHLRP